MNEIKLAIETLDANNSFLTRLLDQLINIDGSVSFLIACNEKVINGLEGLI